ncbi:hypothetical protein [uncultured Methanobrevibacter sp.]|uniref:hypothetical protein n=1 Tax=uncultured Methanobrevibacter sp. TaxID=253161 RepID=UPI00260C4DE6
MILIVSAISLSSVSAEDTSIGNLSTANEMEIADSDFNNEMEIDNSNQIESLEKDTALKKESEDSKLSDNDDKYEVNYEIMIPDSVRKGGYTTFEEDLYDYFSTVSCTFFDDVDGNYSISVDGLEVYNRPIISYWDDDYEEDYFDLNDLNLSYGTHSIEVKFDGNDEYAPFSVQKEFEYYYFKLLIPENIIKGDWDDRNSAMICEFALDAKGNLTVYIDNKRVFKDSAYDARIRNPADDDELDLESTISISLDSLSFGQHSYTVNYTGSNYESLYLKGSFNISDYYFEVNGIEDEYSYGDVLECEIRLIEGTTKNLILNANGKEYAIVISGNDYSYYCENYYFNELVLGENNLTFTYEDSKLPKRSLTFLINVTGKILAPEWEGIRYMADNRTINLTLPNDAKGNLSLYQSEYNLYGDNEYTAGDLIKSVPMKNGFASIPLYDFPLGQHDFLIRYEGDDYKIEDLITSIQVGPNIDLATGVWSKIINGYSIRVQSPEDFTGRLIIDVYDTEYLKDEDYYEMSNHVKEIYNGSAKGIVNIKYPSLDIGNYYFHIRLFNDDEEIFSKSIMSSIRDENPDWEIIVEIPDEICLDDYYDGEYYISFCPTSIPNDISGDLILYIDGEIVDENSLDDEYEFPLEFIDIGSLSRGSHNWELKYLGDSYYNPTSVNGSFKILKTFPSYIIASSVSTSYKTSKKMTITLMDYNDMPLANKKVSIVLNGKTYTKTTDAKGKISFTVPANLAPKTYIARVKFAGDLDYLSSQTTAKVKVVKAIPKLTAASKTFKLKATKKYTATLKSDKKLAIKNVKISLTVNKKTYTAKTNSKGVVTLKLSKLTKKGKYTAIIKFSGNSYYKAVTKKATISIK